MNSLKLSAAEVRVLWHEIQATKNIKILKRSQTLIWLSEGVSIAEISRRLGVTRQSIYNWVKVTRNKRGFQYRDALKTANILVVHQKS
jgi:transposase